MCADVSICNHAKFLVLCAKARYNQQRWPMRTRTTVLVAVASCLFLTKAFYNVYSVFSGSLAGSGVQSLADRLPGEQSSSAVAIAEKTRTTEVAADPQTSPALLGGTLQEQCLSGHPDSCQAYVEDKKESCENGHLTDCVLVAWTYFDGLPGMRPNVDASLEMFEQTCKRGEQKACTALGRIYRDGKAVAVDASRAASFFDKNCRKGAVADCYELGLLYQNHPQLAAGDRVKPMMERGCEQDYLPACKWMLDHYQEQHVVELSPEDVR